MKYRFTWAKCFSCHLDACLAVCIAIGSLSVTSPAFASDKLMVEYPTVTPGETEIGMRVMAQSDNDPAVNGAQTWKLGVGYGFTNYWFSELYAEYEKPADSSTIKVQYYEWENMFRLSKPGQYWADWAVILEYSYAVDEEEKDAYKIMPIMQKRFRKHMLTLNVGFERNPSENGTNKVQLNYAWQFLWRGNPVYQFALEGYGQFGDVTNWAPASEQTHQIGPALVGKFKSGEDNAWDYRLGVYFGLTDATIDRALMLSLEYEI